MALKTLILSLSTFVLTMPMYSQVTSAEDESAAITAVVATYLAKHDMAAVKRVLATEAKVISVDSVSGRVVETPISKPAKNKKGMTVNPSQKIMSVDITVDGALAKVESEFPPGTSSGLFPTKHIQYISLLKISGEWKIVSILMPPLRFADPAAK